MTEKFSLKDHLFNREKVEYLSELIQKQAPLFDQRRFVKLVLKPFPDLELKQRIQHITETLREMLPDDYRSSIKILLASLPEELDPNKTDDDFGDFIFAPYSYYVASYGCVQKELSFSLNSLEEMTKRFSVEFAIRSFLIKFPEQTLKKINRWATHKNYHVRRLASEGIRPNLPWGQKADVPLKSIIQILDQLYFDPTRFVTRSVANNLNDVSKQKPELVIQTLKKWKKSGKQEEKELDYIINHSLRTLIKQGNPQAMTLLGYPLDPKVSVRQFVIKKRTIKIGESLEFMMDLLAEKNAKLLIDYSIYFRSKNGENRQKVFKLKKVDVKKGEMLKIDKKHPLKVMTTRKLYPGKHHLEIRAVYLPIERFGWGLSALSWIACLAWVGAPGRKEP